MLFKASDVRVTRVISPAVDSDADVCDSLGVQIVVTLGSLPLGICAVTRN